MQAGPRLKKIRRLGTPLPGLTRKAPREDAGRSGAQRSRPRRTSQYRRQLEEKQKVRWHYGITERQLSRSMERAESEAGVTGERLLAQLEARLDSVVFRLGFAPTIRAARQRVAHGHVRVDGRRVDRAGYRVRPGEIVSLSERALKIPDVQAALAHGPEVRLPAYLRLDAGAPGRGYVVSRPERSDVPFLVDETAIVELYAR